MQYGGCMLTLYNEIFIIFKKLTKNKEESLRGGGGEDIFFGGGFFSF